MNELKVFNNEKFGKVRATIINGKPYVCASDVAKALGYEKPNNAINSKCKAILKWDIPISGKIQKVNFIPESDIYRLIFGSKLPSAVEFQDWAFEEVLPTINKTIKTLETIEYQGVIDDIVICKKRHPYYNIKKHIKSI